MEKILDKIGAAAAYIASISIIIILLVTSINVNCFDRDFYTKEYQRLHTAQALGMTEDDLFKSTNTLLDYLKDNRDNIKTEIQIKGNRSEAFNAREASHMVDVRNLYRFANILRYVSIGCLIISLLFLVIYRRNQALKQLSIAFITTSIIFAMFLIMTCIWAIADFDSFWTAFHRLAFRNDLWLLNPSTDLMINLFPSEFFYHMIMRITIMFAVGFIILFIISYLYLRYKLHRVHKELIRHDEV